MKLKTTIFKLFVITLLIFTSCKNDDSLSSGDETVEKEVFNCTDELTVEIETILNPSGYAPLSALVTLKADKPIYTDMRVIGKHGEDSDVIKNFPENRSGHRNSSTWTLFRL